jgi:predicted nucleic acid-binding protein
MTAKIFLDSNLWIYAYDNRDLSKQNITRQLILQNADHIVISTQILGEIYHVLTRKKLQPANQITAIMQDLMENFQLIAIDVAQVRKAIALQAMTRYSYWDSLVVATAITAGCLTLYSEDLQHQRRLENLTILNPFQA